jgi:AraC family transcriptional regulator
MGEIAERLAAARRIERTAESMASGDLTTRPLLNEGAALTGDDACGVEGRVRVLDLSVALVETVRRQGMRRDRSAEKYCPVFQVCLPYRGIHVWHVGGDDVVADANQVLFVIGGESYQLSRPLPGCDAELIITPEFDVLSELAHANGVPLSGHPLFRRRHGLASPRLQSFRTRFLHWATETPDLDYLAAEEVVLALLRSALQEDGRRSARCGAATARLIRRTKEFLDAELSGRLLLNDVGRAVGASPAYLTDTFRRVEGISLHRYLTQLRLARALVELPHAADLTTLALDVGFSSHSHLSQAFRRAFGCTPSEFRQATRRAVRPSPP